MFTTRPEIAGTFGVVATTHWIASSVGMAVLEKGGNAFDAAAAAAFVLQIAEPHLNGPGGDVPIIIHDARAATQHVICGQGVAPDAATPERFASLGLDLVPGTGLLPAVVPGAFDAWMLVLRDWGTWEVNDVLSYAIAYAKAGIHIVPRISAAIESVRPLFEAEWHSSAAVFLPGGKVPGPGTLFARPVLAETWSRVLREAVGSSRQARIDAARNSWYRGFVAEAIGKYYRAQEVLDASGRRHRGLLTADDMAPLGGFSGGPRQLRLSRPYRAEGRALEPGPGVPAAAGAAQGLRHRGDGPAGRRFRAYRHRMRQARLRRSRGLLRRPRFRPGAAGRPAFRRIQRRPPRPCHRPRQHGVASRAGGRVRPAGRPPRGRPHRDAEPGPRRRRADGRAPRRHWRRHLPHRRHRPLGQHGQRHAVRRLAAILAGRAGAWILHRHSRADVLDRSPATPTAWRRASGRAPRCRPAWRCAKASRG